MPPKMQYADDMQYPPTADHRWGIDPEDKIAHLLPARATIGDGTPTLCNRAVSTGLTVILTQYSKFAYRPCDRCIERGKKRVHAGVKAGEHG